MIVQKIIKLNAVESTNNYARGQVSGNQPNVVEGTVVLALHQTNGRGTGRNTWESEAGKNLTFSLILTPSFLNPSQQFFLSIVVSLGVFKFLTSLPGKVRIKWPNDLYIGNDKAGGILIENTIRGNVISNCIAGVGLNLNQEVFVSDAPNPVSLKNITGKNYSIEESLHAVCENIFEFYERLKRGENDNLIETYTSNLYRINEWGMFESAGKVFKGKIVGIDLYGRLMIETRSRGTKAYQFKEVSFLFTDTEG